MSDGYTELRNLGITFRPFEGVPPPSVGMSSPFSASWSSTVETFATELRHLDAKNVVVELGLRDDGDLRIDGLPRANAKLTSDAVRVSFDSKFGPLQYATGEFGRTWWNSRSLDGWQANIRAVALALEALRKVDRYGVSKRGEQYTGWRALTASTDPADAIVTRAQAQAVIDVYGGVVEAVKATHPDAGGSADDFRRVQRAREILARA